MRRLLPTRRATNRRRLIVGLGNPGPEYQRTRHNVGFLVVDRLLARHPCQTSRNKFHGELFQVREGPEEQWLVLKPHTYMNRSGLSVAAAVGYYGIELADVLVVCDDFNLPLGRLRLRRGGSDGGQKGLADIIAQLGTTEFPRLRIGIAAPQGEAIEHVLGSFSPDELPVIAEAVERAVDGIEWWSREGIEAAMNRVNAG